MLTELQAFGSSIGMIALGCALLAHATKQPRTRERESWAFPGTVLVASGSAPLLIALAIWAPVP